MQFIGVCAARIGRLINFKDVSRDIGVSEAAVKRWLSANNASGLVFFLYLYSLNVKKRVVRMPKLYFSDTGLAAYLTGWRDIATLRNGAMAGTYFKKSCHKRNQKIARKPSQTDASVECCGERCVCCPCGICLRFQEHLHFISFLVFCYYNG